MTELEALCAELACGDDARAEKAASRLNELGPKAMKPLRSLLRDTDADARWWAVRAIAGFENTSEATADLVLALDDKSENVRQAAALAFCHHPDPQALEPLARALSDPDPMTARLAAKALISLGKQATPVLLEILQQEQSASLEAVRALAEIKDPRAIPALLKALETDSALIHYWAGLALDHLGVGMVYLKPE